MDQVRGEIELYNEWFAQADVDRDNRLSGSEAVSFFSKSGLNKQTLFKIWQGVAGDRSFLSRQEFYTAMKLVAVAQGRGGVLEDSMMARVVNGLGEKVGVPRMAGLNDTDGFGNGPSVTPTGPSAPHGHAYNAQTTQDTFPPMTPEKARVYQTAFDQLDTTNRQILTGGACFGAFMQSGLSKSTLKDIWDAVAGNSGELNRHQFVQCMYLIDWVKSSGQGQPIPKVLPPQFPPISTDGGGVGTISSSLVRGDIFLSGAAIATSMPEKAVFMGSGFPTGLQQHVATSTSSYTAAAQYTSLSAQEQENLAEQERLAKHQEQQLLRAEQQRKEIAERQQFYTSALAELRLSQSKSSRELVDAEQRLELERKACAEMEAQYEAAYEEFNEQHARIGPVLKTLEEIEAEKSALLSKKAALESAVKNLEEYNPEWEAKERGECETLRIEIAELIAHHAALEKSTEAMKRRRASMVGVIEGLKAKIEAEKMEVGTLKDEIDALDDEKSTEGEVLVGLLQQVTPLYTRLYAAARDALVPLPNEVVLGAGKSSMASQKIQTYEYDPSRYGAYDSSDWHVFHEEEFSIATVIPVDDRLETFISPSVRAIEEEAMRSVEHEVVTESRVSDNNSDDHQDERGMDEPNAEAKPTKPTERDEEQTTIDNPVFDNETADAGDAKGPETGADTTTSTPAA